MESAERKKLLNYIKAAIDLETEIATQEQMALSVKNTWDTKKPSFTPDELPKKQIAYESTESGVGWLTLLVFDIIPFLTAAFAQFGIHAPSIAKWVWIITFAIAALAIGLKVIDMRKCNAARKRNIEKTRKFNEKCNQVAKENEKNEKVYERNLRKWNESKNNIITYMRQPLSDTKAVLEKLYSQNIIYPKYCNLPALTSIYEYFMTGRCEELSGPHGAYNMYEDEMRKDTVISQLSQVIDNLEQIKNSQYMLYQQVNTIRQNTATVVNELKAVKDYT